MAPLTGSLALWQRLCTLALPLLAGGSAIALAANAPPPLEQAVKASYITKFAPFIEWPAGAFANPDGPFMICLAGHDAFGSTLDEIARGQKVKGRRIQVRRIGDTLSPGACHMLVIGEGTPNALLAQVAGQPVLTVADRSAGLDGGMIRFVRRAGRVRFEIDNGAARVAHLAISSKLLGLAVTVAR
ncbi:YfiR family protein [Sphingomonadaceae bacterium G21617-S1]|nr:YfiR family protein [Sphingomonadaceae bacterium G21617-S1]